MTQLDLTQPEVDRLFLDFEHAREAGVTTKTAIAYAAMMFLGGREGLRHLKIVSGHRSREHQLALRKRWMSGNRDGLIVQPAPPDRSRHVLGTAFDLERHPDLDRYGDIAEELGLRWGGFFADRDAVHFDLG